MDRRIDHHRHLVGILCRNLIVHLEEVAVFLGDDVPAVPLDGIPEIEVYGQPGLSDAPALVALLLGITRGHVPGDQVAEARIFLFEVIEPFGFGDIPGGPACRRLFSGPIPGRRS